MIIGVIGLGKLGLPLALCFAQAKHRVLVWDSDHAVRSSLTSRSPLIDEPQVVGLLAETDLEPTRPEHMAEEANAIFVIVPTPTTDTGRFDISLVRSALQAIGPAVGTPVACVSTVSPGSSRADLKPIADEFGQRLVYAPTVIALGTVVHDLTNPEIQTIGHDDTEAGKQAAEIIAMALRSIAPHAPQHIMNYESAELTKLSANVFSAFKVSFANMIGRMSDQYNADVDDVLSALAVHRRIGGVSLNAGAGYGGPCWPRDVRAFVEAGSDLGTYVDKMNRDHMKWVVDWICWITEAHGLEPAEATYAVLGKAYKDGTNYRFESFGDDLDDHLRSLGMHRVTVRDADVVVIAQPLREVNLCSKIKRGAAVLDLWRTHRYLGTCPGVEYHPFGSMQ